MVTSRIWSNKSCFYNFQPTTIVFEIDDPNAALNPFTIWFNNLEAALQQFQQDYLKYNNTNFDPDHKLTIDISKNSINTGNIVLGGRYVDGAPNITGEVKSNTITKDPAISSLANFLRNQSIIHQETRKLIKKEDPSDYDFHLVYNEGKPTPLYVDGSTLLWTDNSRSSKSDKVKSRVRRQAVLDVPIPVARPFYSGKLIFI